jgi:hypothetical protein
MLMKQSVPQWNMQSLFTERLPHGITTKHDLLESNLKVKHCKNDQKPYDTSSIGDPFLIALNFFVSSL